jgi:MoaA/NifB/PqqE/SkfB family radical SAM enzyme
MQLTEKYNSPHRLHLETTKRCNLLCEHCYVSASDNFEYHKLEQLKKQFLQLHKEPLALLLLVGNF